MRARWIITLAVTLWLAAFGRDRFDQWVDATVLPPLVVETSIEVLDRKGDLLRAYTVADGRWRLAPPYDLTHCPGYRGEHFMDVAGEGKAPTRAHVLAAAQKAGLAPTVAKRVIDEVLECLTPSVVLAHAKALPLARSTVTTVHRVMSANHVRLAK